MDRLYRLRPALILFLLVMLPVSVLAQADMMHEFTRYGRPLFHLDTVSLLGTETTKSRLLVYVDIAYDDLQFIQSGRGYEASYEVDLSVLAGTDEDAPRVSNKLWRSTVIAKSFDQTNSLAMMDVSEIYVDLPGGTYTLVAVLTDLESKKNAKVREVIQVPTFGISDLEMGDIVTARKVNVTPDGFFEIVPNINRVVLSSRDPIYFYYEIYPSHHDSLYLYSRVLNSQGEIVREFNKTIEATTPVTRDFEMIPIKDFPVGRYVYEMQVRADGRTALRAAEFRIHLSGLPGSIADIETAIRQLRYVAQTSDLKRMLDAPDSEKEQLFVEFWKNRDPSPDTPVNELMQEYYSRIERANLLFGSFREGWETDRGEVYIRFGPPSEVERHPYEIDSKPYEIWYYFEIQRQFVFIDELGYGEYRLVSNLWR